jgi:tripartite-type tricarboxylate transporter receptor subunit TctC
LLVVPGVRAQDYPNKPIRIVVGFAPGGATDSLARTLAEGLRKTFGQPVTVDNRPGANGTIGAEFVAKSPSDGYTIMVASVGALVINTYMSPRPGYDTLKDFAPISLLVVNDAVLLVNNDFPVRTFADFVRVLKEKPGKYGFGTSGNGSNAHLGGEMLKRAVGVDMFHVPYKGDAEALRDLAAGHVPITISIVASAQGLVKSGTVRAVAALGTERSKQLPEVPTVAESGYPGFSGGAGWLGLLAPAGTPPEIVHKLNTAVRRVIADAEVTKTIEALGSRPAPNSPEEFSRYIGTEIGRYGEIIRDVN